MGSQTHGGCTSRLLRPVSMLLPSHAAAELHLAAEWQPSQPCAARSRRSTSAALGLWSGWGAMHRSIRRTTSCRQNSREAHMRGSSPNRAHPALACHCHVLSSQEDVGRKQQRAVDHSNAHSPRGSRAAPAAAPTPRGCSAGGGWLARQAACPGRICRRPGCRGTPAAARGLQHWGAGHVAGARMWQLWMMPGCTPAAPRGNHAAPACGGAHQHTGV